ncbi:MAG: hypothetical protein IVW53_10045 [Chloroflexi bacterium]|nr:hypothetical protein [Chloroflexota bacterium]
MPRLIVASLLSLVLAGCGSTPGPTATPVSAIPTGSPTGIPTATVAPSVPPATSPSPTTVDVVPGAFTTPTPPPAGSAWTTIRWHRLAATDSLALVQSVLRWRGGFIAVGRDASSTPVWTSRDGTHWEPLPFNTATTFWPGLLVVGVAEVRTGLVALTVLAGPNDCSGASACQTYSATVPLMSWTSPDGRAWAPHTGPDLGLPSEWRGVPILAAGPTGLVAASMGSGAREATSVDGIHWRTVPAGALPKDAAVRDVRGTTTGFVAVAQTSAVGASVTGSVALRSTDGRTWSSTPLLPVKAPRIARVDRLLQGANGFLATGWDYGLPGTTLWWWSADGRRWQTVSGYPPIGACAPAICLGTEPAGDLGADGTRMVAYRGGSRPGAWTSSDGRSWTWLAPAGPALTLFQAGGSLVVLPGGVLVSDGSSTWFGEAGTR